MKKNTKYWSEIHEQHLAVKKCLDINIPELMRLRDELETRGIKDIVFAARGSSEHAAETGVYLLNIQTDYRASLCSPSVITCYDSKVDYSNTLVVGISQSGGAKDVFEVMNKCINDGGICVSITNVKDSIMANIGHYRLNNECGQEISITASKSYMTQLALCTALSAVLSNNQNNIDSLQDLPQIIESAYELDNQICENIGYLRNCDKVMLFGRGLLYSVAQEAELKIQETCYLDARAYAASDYQHGPVATTQRFVPTIFFISDTLTNKSIIDLHERLKEEYKVTSLIISDSEEIGNLGDHKIVFSSNASILDSIFSTAVISQLISCNLSVARGYDPDNPVGVSKNTVTI